MSSAQASLARVLGAGSSLPGLSSAVLRSNVSGVVRDRTGRPQIGAVVELLSAEYGVVARTFTDDRGRYTLPRLGAGLYQVKASSSLFLPTIHPDLRLLANSKVVINLTLSTLYQALEWLPVEPRAPDSPADDWNWTLRLSANRPLLRMLNEADARAVEIAAAQAQAARIGADEEDKDGEDDGGPVGPVLIEPAPAEGDAGVGAGSRQVAIHSGLRRFGQGGLAQQVVWSSNGSQSRTVLLAAQTATDFGGPAGFAGGLGRISTAAAYRQELSPDRSMTTIVTLADRPSIHAGASGDGLATMRVRSASTVRLGDLAELSAGTELEAAQLGGGRTVLGSHPFAGLEVHAGQTLVRYSVASAPGAAGAGQMARQAAEDAPAVSETDGILRMEQGLHQELQISRKVRSWTGEVSFFHDTLAHPVIEGAVAGDAATLDLDNVLYDPGTGTIAVSGRGYSGGGVMALLRDQLSPDTWLSLRYAMGEAVAMPELGPRSGNLAQAFVSERTPMASIAAGTRLPVSGTVVRGSYRWQPAAALTQVAPFDEGGAAGIPDAYLSLSIRQPLHLERVGAGKLEAILDVRNLLAEGYRPFLSQDGSTVYFAQAQRCVAAGIAFSF